MLTFAFIGLGIGAVTALTAQGLVLTFRGSGVVNLALGAFAMIGAFSFHDAQQRGASTPVAVLIALCLSGFVGAMMHLLVLRRIPGSTLVKVVATLGLLTAVQAACLLRYSGQLTLIPALLPSSPVHVAGAVVGTDKLWMLGISGALGCGLWAAYRYTKFGLATTAVAENQRAAAALGWSPDLIATLNWVLGAVLTAGAGILVTPIIGLSVAQLGGLLMPALAAALVGGFRSFGLTWAAALGLGIAQSELTRYVDVVGLADSIPFVVVIVVLGLRGRAIPVRGFVSDRLPRVGTGRVGVVRAAVLTLAAVGGIMVLSASWAQAAGTTCIVGVICLSVVVVTGYAGQLSLAQFVLAGIGGYLAARSAALFGIPFWLAALLGVAGTIPVGVIVGMPSLRTRGVSLGIATLGLALTIQNTVFANNDLTGGVTGTVVKPPSLLGLSFDPVENPQRFAALTAVCLILAALLVANLRRGRLGRLLLAVRSNERAAASLGVGVASAKLLSFAIGSALAALAGVLMAFQTRNVTFVGFDALQSIQMVVLTVLGGAGLISGAITGGLATNGGLMSFGIQQASISGQWLALATGVFLLVGVTTAPDGGAAKAAEIGGIVWQRIRWRGAPAGPVGDTRREGVDKPVDPRTPDLKRPRPALRIENLGVQFGGVRAVDDVSLEVASGEILGLIGANGAGKTTFIDLVTGITRADSGRVLLGDEDITDLTAHQRSRRGVVRSFQSLELFDDLTIRDNLAVASEKARVLSTLSDLIRPRRPELTEIATAAIREFALSGEIDRFPEELAYGHRRLAAIARAVAAEPAILLLDEPAAGLDSAERGELARLLRWVADELDIGVLLVEHDVGLVTSVCSRVAVLDRGRLLAVGEPAHIRNHPAVIAAYLGSSDATGTGAGSAEEVPVTPESTSRRQR